MSIYPCDFLSAPYPRDLFRSLLSARQPQPSFGTPHRRTCPRRRKIAAGQKRESSIFFFVRCAPAKSRKKSLAISCQYRFVFHLISPGPARFATGFSAAYSASTSVPAAMSSPPATVLTVTFSPRKAKASTIVMTTLNLSMGATRDTSPSCTAR